MSEWYPISTAPKDGTEVWAFVPAYEPQQSVMAYCNEAGMWIFAEEVLTDIDPAPDQPTHWRHLPEPPEDVQ